MKLVMVLSPSVGVTPQINFLAVSCECGCDFVWPTNVSLARCPQCQKEELWHSVDPKPKKGPWSEPEMENCLPEWKPAQDLRRATN